MISFRFWRDIRPPAWRYAVSILLALFSTGIGFLIPVLTGRAVDGPIADHDYRGLVLIALLVVAVGFAESLAQLIRRMITAGMTADWEVLWRRRLFSDLQRLDITHHDEWDSGQMLSRATNDLTQLGRCFTAFGLPFLVITLCLVVLGGVILSFIQPVFVVLLVLMSLPTMAGVAWFNSRYKITRPRRAGHDGRGLHLRRGIGPGHPRPTGLRAQPLGRAVIPPHRRTPARPREPGEGRLDAWLFGAIMLLPTWRWSPSPPSARGAS